MKASIVTIGDEILIGQIIDTNSAWIGQQFNEIGIEVHEIISVKDTMEGIRIGIDQASAVSDVVLITGGLGPTKDDLTCEALAEYFGVELVFNDALWTHIQGLFSRRGRSTTDLHKQQCFLPANADILSNRMGTAPGMLIKSGTKSYISMPGVPYEMKAIMQDHVLPLLSPKSNINIVHKTIMTSGQGESMLSKQIEDIEQNLPAHIKLAFLPSLGKVRIRLTGRGQDEQSLQKDIDSFTTQITDRLSTYVYGFDDIPFEEALGKLCQEKGLTITTAESCTGGLVASKIVSIPGSSAYYSGSIVAYSYEMKEALLFVPHDILVEHGAVSEDVVKYMLAGVLKQTGADVGVAISGIAGPGGGTADKPVGTIWMACGNIKKQETKHILISKDRHMNIEYTSNVALNMIRQFVLTNY